MASDDPDLADETPAVPSRRKRRAALFVSGGLVLAVAAIWVLRAPIADNFVSTQLQQRGVKAQYRIVSIGTRTQTLADVVIGDPAKPDLIARLVKVNIGWTWSGPVISGVSAEGVRLFGRWQDGRIRLGEVDKLLPEPSDEPFRLPELDVALSDARARLDTPWGAVGARVDGAGPLRYNWRGQLALVSDGLTHAGCDTGRVSVFGAVRISFARPNFTGPVRAAKLRCAQADFSLGRIDSQLEASLAADFLSWTGEFDATSSRWRGAGGTLASLTATGNFRGDTKATKVDYDLRGGAARYGGFSVAGLSLIGAATIGSEPTASARLGVARAVLPPQYRTQVAQSGAMLRSTPVGSIAEQLTRAAANALTSLSGEADVLLVGDAKTRRIEIVAPRLRSVSGAQLRGDASSRLSVRLAGKQPQFLVDGRWQMEGGGLPDSDVRLQRAANGRLTGLASLKPLVAGDSRLALTPVTIIGDPNGRLRIVTTAALSGPLAGGRVDGLTMMLDATVQPNGDFALAGGRDLVMMHFDFDPLFLKGQAHRRADVLQRINRRHREIAPLDRGTVPHVAAFVIFTRRPRRFAGFHAHGGTGHVDIPGHRVKHEEFGFRSEISRIADAGGLEISLGALGNRARVAVIAFAVRGLHHVAGQYQRSLVGKRVHARAAGIRHQQHVRGLDALPAGDRRAVKSMAIGKLVFIKYFGGNSDMLFLAPGIGKTQVNEFDFVVLEHFHDIGSASHLTLLAIKGIG